MIVLKIIYKALVMEHCLSKVKDLNGDREPPFPFFKFSFSCMETWSCACLFILLCLHFYSYFRTIEVYYVYCLFYFDIAFTHFVEKMRIQNTQNSEKENSETKQAVRTKKEEVMFSFSLLLLCGIVHFYEHHLLL